MKKNLFFAVAFVALLFTSCYQVCYNNPLDRPGQVAFTGSVGNTTTLSTRVTNTGWSANDQIGIFAIEAGEAFVSANIQDANIMYRTATGNGIFLAGNTAEAIIFPTTGALDFIAYYPWTADISAYTLNIPVNGVSFTNQTALTGAAGQSAHTILWSNNATNRTAANYNVQLQFQRRMAQLVLTVYGGAGVPNLSGMTVDVRDLAVSGSMNLANGTVTPSVTTGTVQTNVALSPTANYRAVSTSILFPGQNLNNATIRFTLVNGDTFTWTPPSQPIASGNFYAYTLQLTDGGVILVAEGATIGDWTPGNTPGGGIVLTPDEWNVGATAVSLGAALGTTSTITVTAPATQEWTVSSDQPTWLQVNTPNIGTGDFTVTTLSANTTSEPRTAIVTVTPIGTTSLEPLTITVTQVAPLLFPGSNFNDWDAFMGSLLPNSLGTNSPDGLNPIAVRSATGGVGGTGALKIDARITSVSNLFAANLPPNWYVGASSISFDIYGTADRSMSVILLSVPNPAQTGVIAHAFNLGDITTDTTITSTGMAPAYPGSINTVGWVTVTLSLAGLDLSEVERFQIRLGGLSGGNDWDIYIDNILIQ